MSKSLLLGCGAGLVLVGACAAMTRLPDLTERPVLFLTLFALAFLCYAAGVWRLRVGGTPALLVILGLGVAARLVLLPAAPTLSTDAYRYVWDARVAHAGINPYLHAPWARELEPLRDREIFPKLNHPTWRTIYPLGAQRLFQAVYRIRPDSVTAIKVAIGLAELVGLATVLGFLRAASQPLSQVIIYAWNPLVLVEVWGSGHLEGALIPAVSGAAWAAIRGRYALSGALLGAATVIKLYPAALLALLPLTAWPAALLGFGGTVLLVYGPALLAAEASLGSLPRYLSEEYFNPGLVRSLLDVPELTLAAGGILLLWIMAARREAPLPTRAVWLTGGLVLLSPNLFPWYSVWLVAFLAVSPSLPWIAFSGSVICAYAFFIPQPWLVPWWARLLEFSPLAAGGLWWLLARYPAIAAGRRAPSIAAEERRG